MLCLKQETHNMRTPPALNYAAEGRRRRHERPRMVWALVAQLCALFVFHLSGFVCRSLMALRVLGICFEPIV